MATPLTADQFVAALRAEGVTVKERSGWRTHNRNHKGAWGPMNGVVIHHTAGRDSLALVYNGTDALPGPLCHSHLAKNGVVTMISSGRANHAGTFANNAHAAVVAESSRHPAPSKSEPVDGNAHYYGIEIENLGNGKDPYPQAQYDTAVKWAAAICRHHGWSAQSVIGHKEGTTRKIDPKGPIGTAKGPMWDMDTFRADVQKQLCGKPTTKPAPAPSKPAAKPTVSLSAILDAARRDPAGPNGATSHRTDVLRVENALHAEGLLVGAWVDGSFGTLTVAAYQKWQRRLGYRGRDADGMPGKTSLVKLGARHGWTVTD
ncbi:N-acetylmuramoyl-L-alanine amidase [Streptomyces sp. NPDC050145]|uniref:N-acetylmuramoyl-L-alanine amidase n=1 Tax=Streptomyces sp. NPDC050145 TaxID=3365602 RepID=UPI0037A4EA77